MGSVMLHSLEPELLRSFVAIAETGSFTAAAKRVNRTQAAFDRDALAGEVTIGAPDDYASTFLPRILARFSRTHPGVQVNVVCRPSCELLPCLAHGSVDLALITQGNGEEGGVLV